MAVAGMQQSSAMIDMYAYKLVLSSFLICGDTRKQGRFQYTPGRICTAESPTKAIEGERDLLLFKIGRTVSIKTVMHLRILDDNCNHQKLPSQEGRSILCGSLGECPLTLYPSPSNSQPPFRVFRTSTHKLCRESM